MEQRESKPEYSTIYCPFFRIRIFFIYWQRYANGNRISGFGFYYEYNNFNQLARVRESNANGPIIEEYSYWPDGTRSRKWEPQKNQTTYYFDKSFVRVVNASGTFDTIYYYDSKDLIARKELWSGKESLV